MDKKKEADYPDPKGEVYWTRKMRTFFRRLDVRGHGFLNLSDCLNVAAEIIGSFKNMDGYKGDKISNILVQIWYKTIAANIEEKQRTTAIINESQFIDNIKVSSHKGGHWRSNCSEFVDTFFSAADEDDCGKISLLQFKNLIKAWQAPDTHLDLIFRLADTDRDGKITKEEYEYIIADFYFSEDAKSKVTNLFGRLVSYKRPEDYGKLEFGQYWEGKIRTMFRRFDISASKKLRCHDFIQIARGITQRGRLDKKKANVVLTGMLNVWVRWIGIDKEGKPIEEINEKEFVHNLRVLINGSYRHEIDQFGWTFFKAMEIDGSGYISLQEFRNLQEAWGVEREEAEAIFKTLDIDKDNKLSSDEYLTGWIDYFLGEESKSQYRGFFGPVIAKFEAH